MKKELLLNVSGDILLLLKRAYKGKLKLDVILECMGMGKGSSHSSFSDTDYRGRDE